MDKEALRELAEDLAMNHEFCPKDVILNASDAILNLLAEIQSLTEDRTAWRTTAESAEAELKAIKEAEPVGYVTPETVSLLQSFSQEDWCAIWNRKTVKLTVPLYTLEGKS